MPVAATNSGVTSYERTTAEVQDTTGSHHGEGSTRIDRMGQSRKMIEKLSAAGIRSDRKFTSEGQDQAPAPADLCSCPKDLYVLWAEFEVGVDGNKPARHFTPAERSKVKFKYCRRKIVWDAIDRMVEAGTTAQDAIDRIYAEYGRLPVNRIINELKKARAAGNPSLGITSKDDDWL